MEVISTGKHGVHLENSKAGQNGTDRRTVQLTKSSRSGQRKPDKPSLGMNHIGHEGRPDPKLGKLNHRPSEADKRRVGRADTAVEGGSSAALNTHKQRTASAPGGNLPGKGQYGDIFSSLLLFTTLTFLGIEEEVGKKSHDIQLRKKLLKRSSNVELTFEKLSLNQKDKEKLSENKAKNQKVSNKEVKLKKEKSVTIANEKELFSYVVSHRLSCKIHPQLIVTAVFHRQYVLQILHLVFCYLLFCLLPHCRTLDDGITERLGSGGGRV